MISALQYPVSSSLSSVIPIIPLGSQLLYLPLLLVAEVPGCGGGVEDLSCKEGGGGGGEKGLSLEIVTESGRLGQED